MTDAMREHVARIELGELPTMFAYQVDRLGAERMAILYGTIRHEATWAGFCRAWWGIAYVRMQAFEREADAIDAAEEWA